MSGELLFDVRRNELGHLEHADLLLTAENGLEGWVGVNLGPLLRVLKVILLDVVPEPLGEFTARSCFWSDDRAQHGIGLNRLHERGVRFAFGGCFCCRHLAIKGETQCLLKKNHWEKGNSLGQVSRCNPHGFAPRTCPRSAGSQFPRRGWSSAERGGLGSLHGSRGVRRESFGKKGVAEWRPLRHSFRPASENS